VKTLHRYLTGQVLASLSMTVAVFTFVLLLGNVLKEVLALLVNQQASVATVVQAVALLIPYVLVFALPMGLLTATLLTFGRFSADNELTAVRASGVSLLSLISPILVVSVLLSGACAFVNLQLAPQCRVAYKKLLVKTATENLDRLLPERTLIRQFHPYMIYFGRVRGNDVRNIYVYKVSKGGTNVESLTTAPTGSFFIDRTNRTIRLLLRDAWYVETKEGERQPVFFGEAPPIEIALTERPEKEPSLNDLTFTELRRKRQEMKAEGMLTTPVDVQIHSQVSFSFACIAFTLVGIPLGIRAHRRETSVGIMIALGLVFLYYSFLILGQSLDTREEFKPYFIVWLPNVFFQIAGMVLLRRVNRGV
jgi:lipopolysaccharide export system permease protein